MWMVVLFICGGLCIDYVVSFVCEINVWLFEWVW